MRIRADDISSIARANVVAQVTLCFAFFVCMAGVGCDQNANGDYKTFKDLQEEDAFESVTESSDAGESSDVLPEETAAVLPESTDVSDDPESEDPIEPAAVAQPLNSEVLIDPRTGERITAAEEPLQETGTRNEIVVAPKEIKLLIPENKFTPDRETGALRVSYDDIDLLKILNMEPVPADAEKHFPDWLKSLDGQRIRIRGFMFPAFKMTGLTGFRLARDNGICCFVRKAKIYDLFIVRLADGETTDYIEGRPFDVVGTFHIETVVEDDELLQLYHISEGRVIAK